MNRVISASILSADFSKLGDQISQVQQAGADWIHIDVMDGHFVPNMTMGPNIVEVCRSLTALPLDVHLMVEYPERIIESFASAGANILSVHIETGYNIHRTLQSIHELGCKAGIVLNPGTPASAISAVLSIVDLVLVMTVNPGFGGQEYIEDVTPKIVEVRRMLEQKGTPTWLEVDGGISADTLPKTLRAGADAFVAGTSIFKHPGGIAAGVRNLRQALVV